MKNKKGFEMSFGWIFAIIVGAFILFLALFAVKNIISTSQFQEYTEIAKKISIILDPLETGIAESVQLTPLEFKKPTRTYFACQNYGSVFGAQRISFSEKSGIGGKSWGEAGAEIYISNKYIFSQDIEEGKKLYLSSKPFSIGFRVSDLIFISANEYCFVNAFEGIKEDLENWGLLNVNLTDNINNCKKESIKICFKDVGTPINDCDKVVYGLCNQANCENVYDFGYVEFKGSSDKSYFIDSLIYGAIFSSNELYECNVQRLGKRISGLSNIYSEKIDFVSSRKCSSNIKEELNYLSLISGNISSSIELERLREIGLNINKKNEKEICKIY